MVQPPYTIVSGSPQDGESTPDQDPAIRLDGQAVDRAVGSRIEGCIQGAIEMQAADAVAGLTTQCGEISSHYNAAIGLDCQGKNNAAIRPRVEARIHAAVSIQSADMVASFAAQCGKLSTHQDPAIGLQGQSIDHTIRTRIKAGIESSVCIQAPDIVHARHRPGW